MIPEMKWAWLLLPPFCSFFLEGVRQYGCGALKKGA